MNSITVGNSPDDGIYKIYFEIIKDRIKLINVNIIYMKAFFSINSTKKWAVPITFSTLIESL